jgi:hypothetical protein
MKIIKSPIAILLVFAIITIVGCEREADKISAEFNVTITDLPNNVEFDGAILRFEGEGETVGFDVELSTVGRLYVLLPTNDPWLTFVRQGNHVLLTAAENRSGIPRSSNIRFAFEEIIKRIEVYQDYLRLISFPEGYELTVNANQANVTFAMSTNIAQANLTAKVTEPENAYWINPIAVTNNAVTFTVARNSSPIDARQATITVTGEGVSNSFVVKQKPMSVTDIPENE